MLRKQNRVREKTHIRLYTNNCIHTDMSKANLMGKQEMIKELEYMRKDVIATIPDGQQAGEAHGRALNRIQTIKERIEALKIA